MFPRSITWMLLRFAVLGTTLATVSLWACSVPVFRYPLEQWPPDVYQATVFHRGPLSAAQQALARELNGDGPAGRLRANVSLQTVDLAQNPAPELLDFWRELRAENLPWLLVRYPHAVRLPDQIISASFVETTVRQLLDSPARKELTRRVAQGDSAVWVLLESGDRCLTTPLRSSSSSAWTTSRPCSSCRPSRRRTSRTDWFPCRRAG